MIRTDVKNWVLYMDVSHVRVTVGSFFPFPPALTEYQMNHHFLILMMLVESPQLENQNVSLTHMPCFLITKATTSVILRVHLAMYFARNLFTN